MRLPGPKRGSYFWNCTRLVPKLLKAAVTELSKPTTKLTIMITVATPAVTPSRVRKLRSLLARMATSAKRAFSIRFSRSITRPPSR
jgi:hypothetical protein